MSKIIVAALLAALVASCVTQQRVCTNDCTWGPRGPHSGQRNCVQHCHFETVAARGPTTPG
jgi:hypothetical protein